ncbi:DinB family protein [Tateyamaria omphalii]|uniref:Damage-inducible protein DinB n=1 Tax=Tateyamaria omphalii TaxID=299262 RepID=A0A1P8N1Q8_9RHOB|nr:DinB family protein [Tateyamaria omphalii]APX14178.1 damage-inducible protein DinB [Tateyamaria omphalii]
MARYNAWQNASLVAAADGLSDAARWQARGAFFGSIARTFNHLLWDDALWLARFDGDERPEMRVPVSLETPSDWDAFKALRGARDAEVSAWAEGLSVADLDGVISWYPGGGDVRVEKQAPVCFAHLFNHQTHHRGQIHGMLTAAGAVPEPTDLPMLG